MKIIFFGDIVGRCGRSSVIKKIPELISRFGIDVVIANGENSAGGVGINVKTAEELYKGGVDLITTGNHIWANKDIYEFLNKNKNRILRPANFPKIAPGVGDVVFKTKTGEDLVVINIQGRVFMDDLLDSPFLIVDKILEKYQNYPFKFVDFHCEATSEKNAMGRYLDGRVSAIFGTHTHVQTADERILPKGTAFITDAGMCGAYESILGVEIDPIVNRFVTCMPSRYQSADGQGFVNGVVFEIENTGKTISIERVFEKI